MQPNKNYDCTVGVELLTSWWIELRAQHRRQQWVTNRFDVECNTNHRVEIRRSWKDYKSRQANLYFDRKRENRYRSTKQPGIQSELTAHVERSVSPVRGALTCRQNWVYQFLTKNLQRIHQSSSRLVHYTKCCAHMHSHVFGDISVTSIWTIEQLLPCRSVSWRVERESTNNIVVVDTSVFEYVQFSSLSDSIWVDNFIGNRVVVDQKLAPEQWSSTKEFYNTVRAWWHNWLVLISWQVAAFAQVSRRAVYSSRTGMSSFPARILLTE